MKRSQTRLILLLVALGAATAWLAQNPDTAPAEDAAAPASAPGYYLTDATLEQTDVNGRRTLLAHAERARQLDAGGDVSLETPTVRYHARTGRDWVMTAREGTLPAGQQRVNLEGDVSLRADATGGAVVRTEHLELDVPAQVATTTDAVRIELAPHALHAHGLRADLTQESLHLEADVHGTFSR